MIGGHLRTEWSAILLVSLGIAPACSSTTTVTPRGDGGESPGGSGGAAGHVGGTGPSQSTGSSASKGGQSARSSATAQLGGTSASGGSEPAGLGGNTLGGNTLGGNTLGGNTLGGATSTSGGTASGGTGLGGTTSTTASSGGTASGGTNGTATTSTELRCSVHSDCADRNPNTSSCSALCVAGTCKYDVDLSLVELKSNATPGYDLPITSVWNSSTPYLIYAQPKDGTGPASVAIQPLNSAAAVNGAKTTFLLPVTHAPVSLLSAALRGASLGLFWQSEVTAVEGQAPFDVTAFAETTLGAAAATPITLSSMTSATQGRERAYQLFASPSATSDWGLFKFSGTPAEWKGYAGPLASAAIPGSRLPNASKAYDPAIGVLGSTVFTLGRSCIPSDGNCAPQLILQRYSLADASNIGDNTQLSTTAVSTDPSIGRPFSPAIGVASASRMVAFWNEPSGTSVALVRAAFAANGSYQVTPLSTAVELYPKAVFSSRLGGGVLIAARPVSKTVTGGTFEVIVQRFDDALSLVGQPYVLGQERLTEPSQVEAHVQSNGNRALVTLRQNGTPWYTLLDTGLCK